MIAGRDIAFGLLRFRLFDKAGDRQCALARGDRLPAGDIAIAGLGAVGGDAKGDEQTGFRSFGGPTDRLVKSLRIGDRMIRRHDQHLPVQVAGGNPQGGDRGGRRGVAAGGFEQQPGRLDADLAQLLGNDEAVLLIGDDQRRREPVLPGDPPHRLLQQAGLAEQREQLLRVKRARHRPEARAGAPGQDHRVNHVLTNTPRTLLRRCPYSGVSHQAFLAKRFPGPRATARAFPGRPGRRS